MKKLLLFLIVLSFTTLFSIHHLYAQDCPSSFGTIIPADICGTFSVVLEGADCSAYGGNGGYLFYYDFDVSTTPTQMEIYDDLIGVVDLPDAVWVGESSFCDSAGFVELGPVLGTGCTVQEVAFYIVPVDLVALTIDANCPIEGPIISTVYPTFDVFLVQEPDCDVPAIVELWGADGSVCETLTGPVVARPDCTPGFGDAVNTEILPVVYDEATLAAIAGGTPPAGCFNGGVNTSVFAECASFACEGTGCQLANLTLLGVTCNNNGTATDSSDDFYNVEITFNYVDGTTYTVSDANSGAVYLSGQPYANPASQTETITFTIPANGQFVVITVTDDGAPACTVSLEELGPFVSCSDCTIFSGSSVTTPVCEGAQGIFTVTVGNCDIAPGTIFTSAILMYDLDVTNTPPTDQELYDDIIGAIDAPDLIWFGEFGDCANSGGLSDLQGFENPSCMPLEVDLYLMPVDDAITTVSFDCSIEGPIRLTVLPAEPAYIASCDTNELIAGFDNGDGAGGPPDGDVDDPEDEICASIPFDTSSCPDPPTASYTPAELGALLGNDGSCYNGSSTLTCTCPCDTQAPSVTITGTACADGSMIPPYVVGDDGTAQFSPGDIIEYIVLDDAAGTVTGVPNGVISISSLAEAQAAVDAAPVGTEVCITALVHSPTQLNQIIADLDFCTNGLFSNAILGNPTLPLQSLEQFYDGIVVGGASPNLTLGELESFFGGSGGGPSSGGMLDVGVLAGLPPGLLICDVPPYCYNFMPPTCVTVGDVCPVVCSIAVQISNVACDDNGTPDNPTDDTLTFDYIVTDGGTGTTWTDGTLTNQPYGMAIGVGPLAADGSTWTININDEADIDCQATDSLVLNDCATIDNIPTIGEWGLIILALLMSITAVVGIRQREKTIA